MASAPPFAAGVLVVALADERGLHQQVGEVAEFFEGGNRVGVRMLLEAKRFGLGGVLGTALYDSSSGLVGFGPRAEVHLGDAPADPDGLVVATTVSAIGPGHDPPPCGCSLQGISPFYHFRCARLNSFPT